MTDYIGAFLATPRDLKHYGRKGMKWGQRIFTSTSKAKEGSKGPNGGEMRTVLTNKKTGAAHEINPDGSPGKVLPTKRPSGNIQDNVESSSTRYARLDAQAKSGRASEMTEQDLKFYNARTDALAKINKMNETKPSWLRETTTEVIQSTAKRQMQMVSNALADKYVGDPIKQSILGTTTTSKKSSSDDDDD